MDKIFFDGKDISHMVCSGPKLEGGALTMRIPLAFIDTSGDSYAIRSEIRPCELPTFAQTCLPELKELKELRKTNLAINERLKEEISMLERKNEKLRYVIFAFIVTIASAIANALLVTLL